MRRRIASFCLLVLCCFVWTSCIGQTSREERLKAEFKALDKECTRAEAKLTEALQKAKTDAEKNKIEADMTKRLMATYLPRYRSLEMRARGTEIGANAMLWMLRRASLIRATGGIVPLAPLTRDYIKSPQLEQMTIPLSFLFANFGVTKVENTLQSIAEKSPHRKVRASALFALAQMLKEMQEGHDSLPELRRQLQDSKQRKVSPEDIKQFEDYLAIVEQTDITAGKVLQLFSQVRKDYADTDYAKRAGNSIFELENLAIGKVAPDFEATDQDGKKFKLSDYRGKVVALDFWGFW